ncbi:hypothetical protein EMIHUDRAFT_217402 [Emiliania huxleyi CCMP1516]|uniref:BTB domain-containing protein n=2 Tax=Emiliania huxleyi TaxID=2903 RepID=A0A0D3IBM3_EMIH1|nr:hypothetical protein EMIHUDRAFT_217402 [Emiliania huxleyi CCMP1516]EOD08658.1 hypothetical protein EMIHUDRAFT_217402 [Emiliania huxleyi CCMP1516]|eukprot:XP_005761087.1 hypothetical protein EMIHUDRAFT_217402 [Emiliania huxleyi CCMP1516]
MTAVNVNSPDEDKIMAAKRRRGSDESSTQSSSAAITLECSTAASAAIREDGLRTAIAAQWREGTLCDVDLLVEGTAFKAHRMLLAAESPYLSALVTTAMRERAGPIELKELSAASFAAALSFMYTRRCTLGSQDALQPLLHAAHLLRVPPLLAAAEAAVAERIDASTCLRALGLAEHLSLAALANTAQKLALQHFGTAAEAEDGAALHTLSAEQLGDIIASDDLAVSDESVVLEAVKGWLAAQQPAASQATAGALLAHVRFAELSKEQKVALDDEPLLQQHFKIVATAYREKMHGEDTPRARPRSGSFRCCLQYDDLRVGMMVKVHPDRAFVEEQCRKVVAGATKNCGWAVNMTSTCGSTYRVAELRENSCSARLDIPRVIWHLPYTVLQIVCDA